MGTRADFYVGTGPEAEWLGSVSFDGFEDGWGEKPLAATSEREFRAAVEAVLSESDAMPTRPAEGWPWPWEDSRLTDYAYAWTDAGPVLSCFGTEWVTLERWTETNGDEDETMRRLGDDEVRDMSAEPKVADVMAKSGMIAF